METLFTRRIRIEAPVAEVFTWHARPGAIQRLSPPWDPLTVLASSGGIEKGAEVTMRLRAGPIPFQWRALHTDYEANTLFRDVQVQGPFSLWRHTHRFEVVDDSACILEDQVEYSLPLHPMGNLVAGKAIQKKLQRIFSYRHRTTLNDIARHLPYRQHHPLTVLVSGASGVLGSALIPFLTTGGHRVRRLVRHPSQIGPHDVFWNPAEGVIDRKKLKGVDAVIHLAGENIGDARWSASKRQAIIESRRKGTDLIARTVAALSPKPKVLICASAIGYYGDRGTEVLTEESNPGEDFISKVCVQWEAAAAPAREAGIRTVFARIGVTLTPLGGALSRLMPLFQAGLGATMGNGQHSVSWIGLDDVLGAILHLLKHDQISGPVNLVSPEPTTNRELTRILGTVLSRPALMVIPAAAIKLAFGDMGKEVLLSSSQVFPIQLLKSGYRFSHPGLKGMLMHVLGKEVQYPPTVGRNAR